MTDDRAAYRELIDALVEECRNEASSSWVRAGRWPADEPKQALLDELSEQQRVVLADMLTSSFESGVHQVLAHLHYREIPPFDDDHAYEGSPFHDFVGRLQGWEWPTYDADPR